MTAPYALHSLADAHQELGLPRPAQTDRRWRDAAHHYGWKVGISAGAFPIIAKLKSAPGLRWPSSDLRPTFVHRGAAARYRL